MMELYNATDYDTLVKEQEELWQIFLKVAKGEMHDFELPEFKEFELALDRSKTYYGRWQNYENWKKRNDEGKNIS